MKSRITIALLITLMLFIGATAYAQAPGGPVVPGQPPLSKLIVTGSLVADPDLAVGTRQVTTGREIVMSGPGQQVVQEAYDNILKGGNFYDAAMPMMWLTACLGGQFMPGTGMIATYNAKEHRAASYIGVGTAPALLTMDLVRNVLKLQFPSNETDLGGVGAWVRANLIPQPDTMVALLDRWGTMSWTQAMQGTYEAMMDGIPLSPSFTNTARRMFTNKNQLTLPIYVETRSFWGQGGPNIKEGFMMKRPGAARIIREMADAEQAALAAGKSRHEALVAARDEFYKGGFAKAIDQFSRDTGGFTRWSDYAAYAGQWVEQEEMPHSTFMGVDFYCDSPVSQSPTLIMVFNMLENFDLLKMGYNTPEYIHVITQCFDLAFADRWQYFGDPRFVDVPKELYTKEYAKERVKLINMNRRFARVPPPGDPRNMKATLAGWKEWTLPPKVSSVSTQGTNIAMIDDEGVADTTHCGMIDKDGNVFSHTPSDPGPYVPGYGVGIAGRARQFVYDPAHPASLSPGKRPETTPNTFVGVKDGEGYLETGTTGGDDQIQMAVQVILNYLLWGMNPQVAVDQPRFDTENYISWFTPHIEGYYNPGSTELSRGAPMQMVNALGIKDYPPAATTKALEAKGHKVALRNWAGPGGAPTLTVRDPVTKTIYGGSMGFGSQNEFTWGR
jgi:gamma-glutamyltranspeptidase/glutathione hydrolase